MKYLLAIGIVAMTLVSCKKSETTTNETLQNDTAVVIKSDSVATEKPWVSKNQAFLDKFKTIELDSTRFVAPNYEQKGLGPSLTKKELDLFPKDLDFSSFSSDYKEFEAISKFDINENLIGLVARMPGEYSFTSLKLFFYDKTKDEILQKYFEVADKLGDAGYTEEMKSWLFKDGNQLKSFSHHFTKVEKIEPDDPTRESQTNDYYIIKLSPEKIDTLRVSKTDLPKYHKLLNQK